MTMIKTVIYLALLIIGGLVLLIILISHLPAFFKAIKNAIKFIAEKWPFAKKTKKKASLEDAHVLVKVAVENLRKDQDDIESRKKDLEKDQKSIEIKKQQILDELQKLTQELNDQIIGGEDSEHHKRYF